MKNNSILQYFKNQRKELASYINPNACRVLEIGCGVGNFKSNFKYKIEYWGIEPNKNAAKIAGKNAYKIFSDSYENVYQSLPNSYFDLIICNDVIEHMVDFDFFFKTIKSKMVKGGFIIGSVPNVRFYQNLIKLIFFRDWKYEDEGILDKTHLKFFTRKSLISIFRNHDFKIIDINGINSISIKDSITKYPLKVTICFFLGFDSKYKQIAFKISK